MFRFFLFLAIILVFFVIYNSYINSKANHSKVNPNRTFTAIVYTKTNCPYCFKATNLLDKMKIRYQEVSLNEDKELHEKLINQTTQTTVPYIYINNEFIGGYTDLLALKKQGKFSI
jgi:glutaredoxin 3